MFFLLFVEKIPSIYDETKVIARTSEVMALDVFNVALIRWKFSLNPTLSTLTSVNNKNSYSKIGLLCLLLLQLIIRSHEGPDARTGADDARNMLNGYSKDHDTVSGELYTLFTAPNYPQVQILLGCTMHSRRFIF